ncbi:Rrf2 family transcriptional regulator [Paenibacillus nasutitermitis]|uniref:Rrf2 family transcriptional regulator n=1 Tax=Paenibacillus nasutitermitis TaxID=1652958 RepID=A0A916ZKJ1_9BACL|nr:Rrf2 family transcriptional regulator [Paenibacillus nasutitermitis]GGE02375.1 Rrf2 family transcriptional regulator [Paenibacillus nasutitermitis]
MFDKNYLCNYYDYIKRGVIKVKISARFSVAIHILSMLSIGKNTICTSELVASSVKTNPVVIRRVTGMLKKAGFVNVNLGYGGTTLLKPIDQITLLDVYRAVDVMKEGQLFQIHENTELSCIVGANIQNVLSIIFKKVEISMEDVLASFTIQDVVDDLIKKGTVG